MPVSTPSASVKLIPAIASNRQKLLSHKLYIAYEKMKRYLIIGFLLHLMAMAGTLMAVYFFWKLQQEDLEFLSFSWFLNFYLGLYGASLPIFAQLDARSRYQNYKLLKDKMFRYGFQARLVEPFTWSRCQRDAIQVAANDLGKKQEMKDYLKQLGYRWYHIIPRILLKQPRLILTRAYWTRTLFVKHYRLKYFEY